MHAMALVPFWWRLVDRSLTRRFMGKLEPRRSVGCLCVDQTQWHWAELPRRSANGEAQDAEDRKVSNGQSRAAIGSTDTRSEVAAARGWQVVVHHLWGASAAATIGSYGNGRTESHRHLDLAIVHVTAQLARFRIRPPLPLRVAEGCKQLARWFLHLLVSLLGHRWTLLAQSA